MIRRVCMTLGVVINTGMTMMYAYDIIKARLESIAEKEKATSKADYVLIRFARGDYNRVDGVKLAKNDFKFYDIASKYHTTVAVKPDVVPKPRASE